MSRIDVRVCSMQCCELEKENKPLRAQYTAVSQCVLSVGMKLLIRSKIKIKFLQHLIPLSFDVVLLLV